MNHRFLLGRLQMDSLSNQTSARNIYRALERLPEKLNDTFDDAMDRTAAQPAEHSILANQVISWIFYAKRPLQIAELCEALAVEHGDTRLDQSGRHDVQLSLDVCCGLVSIDEQDNVIRLVHYSFQQYLEDHWKTDCPGSRSGIATICLTYLTLDDFSPEAMEDTKGPTYHLTDPSLPTRARWQDCHRFFSYVASYWAEHVKGNLEKELETLIIRFFLKKVHLLYSLQEYNKTMFRNLQYDSWPHEPSPLHLTAYWGLSHITNVLVGQGADLNAEDAQKRTPLICAALNGQVEVARNLLHLGAVPDVRDSSGTTPLHAAVINDHLDVAKVLTAHGSDTNAQSMDGSTPMVLATSNSNFPMMDLLLQRGAQVENLGERGLSPLEVASRGGHTAAVQWLLMRGAKVNPRNACPLVEAIFANQPHIVRILQDAGADINATNRLGYTALGAAVKQGNINVVQRLLNAGTDVSIHRMSLGDGTPLQMAAFRGDETLVSLLLYHRADVQAQGGELGTVLQAAIYSQNIDVVKIVLRQSPDINISAGRYGTTPLQLAVLLKDSEILTELLIHQADPNMPSSFGTTPLHHAVYLGWKTGIDKLLSYGANPELVDLYGRSCFDSVHPDKDMLSKLGGYRSSYTPTSFEAQERRLRQAVRELVTALLPDPNHRDGRRLDYHYLGHCLLRLNDFEEARTSFEQQIKNVFSKHEPRHNILCHHCDGEEIVGSRFVCYACADIDLCSAHMKQYKSNPPDPRCRKHRFLEVPGPKWKGYGNGRVNDLSETIDEWLARLLMRYKDAAANTRYIAAAEGALERLEWESEGLRTFSESCTYPRSDGSRSFPSRELVSGYGIAF